MKKIALILILMALLILPCDAKVKSDKNTEENSSAKSVFIYHIPDEDIEQDESSAAEEKKDEPVIITSDDVTADTSGNNENEDETEEDDDELESYQIDDMYSDVLKGYAEYNEEEEDAITLEDTDEKTSKIHIKKPAKITQDDYTGLKTTSLKSDSNKYSKYKAPEYSILPMSSTNYRSLGGFSAGTIYNQGIDYGELEQSSGVFSRYQYKQVGLSVSYMKTVNSTNNNYNDNFYFAPEWKMNQYMTLREVLSADVTKNRNKAELVLSINPFGEKDTSRLNFEFGVNRTYYLDDATTKSQFKFSTNFKL